MNDIPRDLRFALRTLFRKHLTLTLVCTATLALGIGANTAIFSVVRGVLLDPLPYQNPDQLIRLYQSWDENPEAKEFMTVPDFLAYRGLDEVFAGLAAFYTYAESGFDLTGSDRPQRVSSTRVSAGFFEVLGYKPILGRSFEREDERSDVRHTVLSHGLWQRRFGADPGILGESIVLDGNPYTVVGVMPAALRMPVGREVDLWTPQDLRLEGSNHRGNHFLTVVGRLQPGVSLEKARAGVEQASRQIVEEFPQAKGRFARVFPLHEDTVGDTRPMLYTLLGAVGLVLLIACVNVANLLLVRGAARRKEFAVRSALGSGRLRLVRQLLTESLLLAALGGVAGGLLALGAIRGLLALKPEALPRIEAISFDFHLFAYGAGITLVTGLIFGLVPAFEPTRVKLASALREGGRGEAGNPRLRRLRGILVTVQMALAVMLLIGSGLLAKSFLKLLEVELGFRPAQVSTFRVHLPESRYKEPEQRVRFYEQLHERLENLPGVTAAGAVSKLPASGRYHHWGFQIEGRDMSNEKVKWFGADMRCADGQYFEAMGINLLRGRLLEPRDRAESENVVVINQALAQRDWPDRDPLGARVIVADEARTVVGVVASTRHDHREAAVPKIYLPHGQFAGNRNWSMTQVAQSDAPHADLLPRIRQEVAALDADLIVHRVRTLDAVVGHGIARQRFAMQLMTAFATVALLLAAVGLYGVLAFFVEQRRREIGIRMALGAEAHHVSRMVLLQGLAVSLAGTGAGLLGSFALSRWLTSLIFEVQPADPTTFLIAACLLLITAAVAGFVPLQRALRVEPLEVLRYE